MNPMSSPFNPRKYPKNKKINRNVKTDPYNPPAAIDMLDKKLRPTTIKVIEWISFAATAVWPTTIAPISETIMTVDLGIRNEASVSN